MCGIFGVVGREPAEGAVLSRAIVSLRHRGPDDSGALSVRSLSGAECCDLAHTRLAIIELSPLGHQPMVSPDGRYSLTFNGEIFNFQEIRSELEARGHAFKGRSDTEVLLHAWMEWGTASLAWLRGFFAFAVFDRESGQVTLARDRLGIKPLYYCFPAGRLAFASEVRALLASGLADRRLDRDGLESYFAFGSAAEPATILAGVEMLAPGTWLRWSPGKEAEHGVFWNFRWETSPEPLPFEEAVERLRVVLTESVRLRLVADVPVGLFLSGGIDSSVLTALAAGQSSKPVQTFTVSFGHEAYDEEGYARSVAEKYGCKHHAVLLDPVRAAAEIDDAVAALDQPSCDGVNTYFVSRATRKEGITVALSGLGGDELFAGYPNFHKVRTYRDAGRRLPRGVLSWLERQLAEHAGFRVPNAASKALAVGATSGELTRIYAVLRAVFTDGQRQRLFGRVGPADRFVMVPQRFPRDGGGVEPATGLSVLELCNYLRNTLLRDTDAMSMASALEVRVPFLDHAVVELALSLPDRLKLLPGRTKALLAATVPDLPRSVTNRPKMGFTLPFAIWFRGPLRGWMEERLFSMELVRSGLVNEAALRQLWTSFLRGERFVSHSRVWALAVLAQWCASNRVSLEPEPGPRKERR